MEDEPRGRNYTAATPLRRGFSSMLAKDWTADPGVHPPHPQLGGVYLSRFCWGGEGYDAIPELRARADFHAARLGADIGNHHRRNHGRDRRDRSSRDRDSP